MEPTFVSAFVSAESFADAALRLVGDAIAHVDGALHASVVVMTRDGLDVVATSDARMAALDTELDGPTIAAVETGRIVRVPTVSRATEFPEYVRRCRSLGISSVASFPIKDDSSSTIGALTITSEDHHGFGTPDLRTGRRIADELGAAHNRAADDDGVRAR